MGAKKEVAPCFDLPKQPAGRPHLIKAEKRDALLAGQTYHSQR